MTRERAELDDGLLPPLDDEPGPMPALTDAEADAAAQRAIHGWAVRLSRARPTAVTGPAQPLWTGQAEQAEQRARRIARLQPRRATQRPAPRLLKAVAGALLACGLAGVSSAAYRLWPAPTRPTARAPAASQEASHAARLRRAAPAGPSSTEVSSLPAALPAAPGTDASARETAPLAPVAAVATPAPAAGERAQRRPFEPSDTQELLASANALRAQRRWVLAERHYRQALGEGAADQQRYVALVAAASINVQHLGRPERALEQFRRALALRPNGELSEEAQLGVAECQRALGDAQAERLTLQRFAAAHPHSWMMESVTHRLAELAAR